MSIIMQNVYRGAINQYKLANECFAGGDFELGVQHFKAAELLCEVFANYIPCLPEEL